MATKVGKVVVELAANSKALKKGFQEAETSLSRFSKSAQSAGKNLTMKVTAPLIGLGAGAAKAASDFEFSMTQIETLVGRTAEEVDTLKGSVLGLSGETGRAPKELADAMFFITSAGLDATSATAALEASAKAAAVGLGDTVIVADAVTNAMNGYGMSADGAAFATDVLAKTVEQGKASAADLAPQFGRLIPMAAELGIGFDQVGAGLAFLTRSSGDAAMSSTALGGVLKSILKPSQQGAETLKEIGLNLNDLRSAASNDLLGALQMLRERLEANGKEMSSVFEDIRGLNGALQLTGVSTDQAREVFDELANSTGKLDEAFLGVQKTAQFKMNQAMAGMKASMVTLGEAVLPVLVPMLQKLASIIGKVAEWFGNLSPTMQRIIVIFGAVAAAIGPVIWILGSITAAFGALSAAAIAAGTTIGAVLGPIGLLMGVVAGGFILWSKWNDGAKKAKEEMETLKNEMIKAGDASVILTTDVEDLTDRLNKLAGVEEETTEKVDEFNQSMVLLQQLIDRDVREAFKKLTIDQETLTAAIETGTDAFDRSNEVKRLLKGTSQLLADGLAKEDQAVQDLFANVKELYDAEQLTLDQAVDILRSVDETADAHDKLAESIEESAEEYFENAENVAAYEKALDKSTVATIDQMVAEGDLQGAMEKVIRETGYLETKTQQMADAAKGGADEADNLAGEMLSVAEATADAVNQMNNFNTAASEMASASADASMMNSARIVTEEEKNRSYWTGVAARNKEKEVQHTENLAKVEKDRQAILDNIETAMADATEKRLAKEKEIADAIAHQESIKKRALDLANRMKKAQQDIKALEAEQASIQKERQQTLEEIASVNDEIESLMAKQASFSATNAEWAATIAQEFRKAELAIMNLEDKVADLQNEVDAVPPDSSTQREFVTALKAQRKVVSTVEQALIDMNVIKEEDAGFMDLTAAEAQTLVRLQEQLQQTQIDMENGEATTLDLMAAEEAWVKGMQSAMEASRELQKAEADLADMETKATKIEKDRKKAMLELEIAQYDLAEAKKIGTEETYLATRAEEEQAKIEEVLNGLYGKRTELQEKQTELALKEVAVVDELKYANERLQAVMQELNNLGEDGNEIWRELMELVHATTGEFRDLINLLKNKAPTSGGGGGGGGGTPTTTTAAATVASTASAVTASGVVVNEWTTMLAGLTENQRGLVGQLYADVAAHRSATAGPSGGMVGFGTGAVMPGVIVNVEGSVISEDDLTHAINLAMQKITNSGGTGPSYEGLGSLVDFGE
jgi:TP901 family phage tail tape measure protein